MIHKELYVIFTMYVQQASHFYLTACFGGIFSYFRGECVTLTTHFSWQVHVQGISSFAHCGSCLEMKHGREHSYKAQCQFYQWQPFPNSPIGSLWDKEDTFLHSSFHFRKQAECSSWSLPWPIRAEAVKGKGFALVCLHRSAGTQSLGPRLEQGQD